jgi:hypothetical protein
VFRGSETAFLIVKSRCAEKHRRFIISAGKSDRLNFRLRNGESEEAS